MSSDETESENWCNAGGDERVLIERWLPLLWVKYVHQKKSGVVVG